MHLAKATASMVWGIPQDRLDAELAGRIALGPGMFPARSIRGAVFRACLVGYGCVVRQNDTLVVVARGTNWQLLAKELVKGTAELICLRGLNQLSEDTYLRVMDATDRVELEPWMLQSGGELWRRLLAALPAEAPVARVLMQLARLPADELSSLLAAVLQEPESAQPRLAGLAGKPRGESPSPGEASAV